MIEKTMVAALDNVERSSTTLFSSQSIANRLKLTLKILIATIILLLVGELYTNGLSVLAIVTSCTGAMLLMFYFWASPDTSSVITGMVLWSIMVFISYVSWLGNGIFDAIVMGLPCLLILAIVLSNKLIFISLYLYAVASLCFLAFAQNQKLLFSALAFDEYFLWRRVFTYIVILTLTLVGMLYIFADIKKRFKNILQKNASLELNIEKLEKQRQFYQLTQLPNENRCEADLEEMLGQQKVSGQILAFITVNIDNLHTIKMDYDHSICDEALKVLADRLVAFVNDKTTIYRFHQNEFVILLHSIDHRGISHFVQKIQKTCAKTCHVTEFEVALHPNIGIAIAPFDGNNMEELRHNSHLAIYTKDAKNAKNGFSFFDQEMAIKEKEKIQITKSLKSAISNNEFILHFQPKIDLATGKIIGAEALTRWISPIHGFVPPTVFIPLAEQAGVITDISHWVIEHAVIACKHWHELGFNNLSIALNLSAEDFKPGNLSTRTLNLLHQADLSAHFLEFELTESMLMDDVNYIQKQMNELRALGISFSLDDFGTGYSNLGYLTKFNVTTIKLDRSFVMNICHSTNELKIVNAIIKMSKSLGITNVAEGIEDKATASMLTELGCDMGQGYYWSKALPKEEFIALLFEED